MNISGDRRGLFYFLRERRVTMLLMGECVICHVVLDAYRISEILGLGLRLRDVLDSKTLEKKDTIHVRVSITSSNRSFYISIYNRKVL